MKRKKPKTANMWEIQSGEISGEYDGDTPGEAFRAAIEYVMEANEQTEILLGALVRFRPTVTERGGRRVWRYQDPAALMEEP